MTDLFSLCAWTRTFRVCGSRGKASFPQPAGLLVWSPTPSVNMLSVLGQNTEPWVILLLLVSERMNGRLSEALCICSPFTKCSPFTVSLFLSSEDQSYTLESQSLSTKMSQTQANVRADPRSLWHMSIIRLQWKSKISTILLQAHVSTIVWPPV